LNKIRRVAEQLVERYPTLFTSDFEKNKQALSTVSVVHTRSLRNQLAGAITKLVREHGPVSTEAEANPPSSQEALLGERLSAEEAIAPDQSSSEESSEQAEKLSQNSSGSGDRSAIASDSDEDSEQTISEAAV
jgi:small subunit ribosomal protein S17e